NTRRRQSADAAESDHDAARHRRVGARLLSRLRKSPSGSHPGGGREHHQLGRGGEQAQGLIGILTERGGRMAWRIGLTLCAVLAAAGLISACTSKARTNAPFCASYSADGNIECSFYSLAQCQASVSGVGGICYRNPRSYEEDYQVPNPRR